MGLVNSKVVYSVGALSSAAILLYTLFKNDNSDSSLKRPNKTGEILGLRNLGHTCFLNALLQALASSPLLQKWLMNKNLVNGIKDNIVPATYQHIRYQMIAVVFRAILVINRHIVKDDNVMMGKVPGDIITVMRQQQLTRKITEEQDAYEFLQIIVSAIETEVELSIRRRQKGSVGCFVEEDECLMYDSTTTDFSVLPSSEEYCNASGDAGVSTSERIMHNYVARMTQDNVLSPVHIDSINYITKNVIPFRGLMATQLQCIQCMKKTGFNCESFTTLSLTLPIRQKRIAECSLQEMIDHYFKPTMVHQVDCLSCSAKYGQPTKSTFNKSIGIARFPNIFSFNIKRTCWSEVDQVLSKRSDLVRFPARLNMKDVKRMQDLMKISTEEQEIKDNASHNEAELVKFKYCQYELISVICHQGDPQFGHFVTLRRSSKATGEAAKWFYVSDEEVNPVTLGYVMSSAAYLLLYERISPR